MHVLITGGAGFIGSHLVERHLDKGDQVHVVDDLSTGSIDNLHNWMQHTDLRFEQADILVWDGLDKAVAWADRIRWCGARRAWARPRSTAAPT